MMRYYDLRINEVVDLDDLAIEFTDAVLKDLTAFYETPMSEFTNDLMENGDLLELPYDTNEDIYYIPSENIIYTETEIIELFTDYLKEFKTSWDVSLNEYISNGEIVLLARGEL